MVENFQSSDSGFLSRFPAFLIQFFSLGGRGCPYNSATRTPKLGESVFRPRIGGVAVTAHFPETRLIFGYELNRTHEFRPFPCVQFRYDNPGRATVIARNRFTVELRRDHRIIVEGIFEPHISRVTIITPEKNVTRLGFGFYDVGQRKESDASPSAIELAPGSDAVEIAHIFELFERIELFPGERFRILHQPTDFQSPIGERDLRFDAEVENWKSLREMLAGREALD